jgi:hypothetical protein
MTQKTADFFNMDRGDILGAGLLGVGAGIGTRAVKRLIELAKGKDYRPPVDLPKIERPSVKMPVELSPEEAAQLEAQGQKVRHVKAAAITGLMDNILTGGLLAGGAYAGWKGLDAYFDNQRRELAKKRLDHARNRVQKLLSDKPDMTDIALHAQMKAAEDHYFAKNAGLGDSILGPINRTLTNAGMGLRNAVGDAAKGALEAGTNMIAPIGIPVALLGTIMAIRAYRKSDKANKYRQAATAIKKFYNNRAVQPADAELEPIVVDKPVAPKPTEPDPIAAAQPLAKAAALGANLKARLDGRLS